MPVHLTLKVVLRYWLSRTEVKKKNDDLDCYHFSKTMCIVILHREIIQLLFCMAGGVFG